MFAGFAVCACVHTTPGTSVEIALAKKAQLVRLPATPAPTPGVVKAPSGLVPGNDRTEMVADAFSRGDFCMKAGKNAEAIAAFHEAVKADPNFTEAWRNLAILYEESGEEKLAMEAFRKSKKIAKQ
jgi:Flp pilus assembly protein TadD